MFDLVVEKPERHSQKHTTHHTDMRKKPLCNRQELTFVRVHVVNVRSSKNNTRGRVSVGVELLFTYLKTGDETRFINMSFYTTHGFIKMCRNVLSSCSY